MKLSVQFVLTTLSKTTKQVCVFALSIILARYFTKADYGTYLHVQLVANIAIWSLLLGIPHSVYYFLPRTYEKRRFVFTTFLFILTIAITVSLLILFNAEGLSGMLANPTLSSLAIVMALLVFFQIPLSIFEPLMIASDNVPIFVRFDFTFNVVFFFIIVIPVVLGYSVIEVLYWITAFHGVQFAIIACVIFYVGFAMNNIETPADLEPNEEGGVENSSYKIKDQFKYSLPIGGSLSLAEVSRYMDKIIVSNQFSPDDYAVYARGAMDIPAISIVANTLDNLLMPKFIAALKENDTQSVIVIWHTAMRMMAAFIYPACVFLIFVAPWLIPALFSEKYEASIIVFQIYTVGLLTKISTFNVIFRAIGRTNVMLWLAAGSLIINIVLTYTCIQLMGVKGAALSVLILSLLYFVACLKIITNYLGVRLSGVLPWLSLVATLMASIASIIPVWVISEFNIPLWPKMMTMAMIFGVCYLVLLRISPALNLSDKDAFRELLPKKARWLI